MASRVATSRAPASSWSQRRRHAARPPPRLQGNASVLPGLEDVLVGLRPGSKIRALVPPELGYQAQPGSQPQVGGEGGREGCWLR